jgi:DNA-binding transcriptional LysR family regulator
MHSSATVLDMVQQDRCDLGFAMFPMRATRLGNSETLVTAKMVGVVPVNHRLARKRVLRPEDFEGESYISLLPLMEVRMKVDSLMLSYGVKRRISAETQTTIAILKLAEAGLGISIVDPLTASGYSGNLLKFIPFEPVIINDYSIVISQRNASTLILKPFIDHARREIRNMVPANLIVRG